VRFYQSEGVVKRGTLVLVLVLVLIIGGFLMIQLVSGGSQGLLPVRVQTENPEASTVMATPNQALAFVVYFIFATGSLIGGGFVLGLLLRFLDRQIARNRSQ